MNKPEFLIIHHEGNSQGNFEIANEYHRQLWNFRSNLGYYLGYQYYLTHEGKLIQARTDDEEGAHTIGYNLKSLGICLQGNFDAEQPTVNQRHNLRIWIKQKMQQYNIPVDKIKGHRWAESAKVQGKSCPGKNLTDNELLEMANYQESNKLETPLKQPNLTNLQAILAKLRSILEKLRNMI